MQRTLIVLLGSICLSIASVADAQSEQGSGYDGLQLAPTVHVAGATPHFRGGVGVDLSLNRWLDLEGWGSRVSHPTANRRYPGAWSAGVAINSRVAWRTHAIVYGAGVVYTSTFYCPVSCSIPSAILFEEDVAAEDLFAAQFRLGYEARMASGWYFRALTTFDLPFASRFEVHIVDTPYDHHEPASSFMHVSTVLALGYAFRLD